MPLCCWSCGTFFGASARKETASPALHVGDHLRSKGGFIARDEASWDRLVQLSGANDRDGMNLMLLAREIRLIDEGTKVLVIGSSWTKVEVRILDGPHAGQSGWTTASFLQP
jgi:hypothetical protein